MPDVFHAIRGPQTPVIVYILAVGSTRASAQLCNQLDLITLPLPASWMVSAAQLTCWFVSIHLKQHQNTQLIDFVINRVSKTKIAFQVWKKILIFFFFSDIPSICYFSYRYMCPGNKPTCVVISCVCSPEFWRVGWCDGDINISCPPSVRRVVLKPYFVSHLADI